MGYTVKQIDTGKASELREKYSDRILYQSKADIAGVCIKLYTENKTHIDMWRENFYSMSSNIRSHGRIVSVVEEGKEMEVLYDRMSRTMFLINFDYYGWIKSIALAVASDILEDGHSIYSVHGAALDLDGVGVTLIAPSKTGKTTQSWGLLRSDKAHLVTDDWYFVRLGCGRPTATGSERNCYIDSDIGDVWTEFKPLVQHVEFDNKGRGIGNVRWITGNESVIPFTSVHHVIFLKRDDNDENIITEFTVDEACEYMEAHDFCNPHQMIRDDYKKQLRMDFFRRYFEKCSLHLVNTRRSPEETQDAIRSVLGIEN